MGDYLYKLNEWAWELRLSETNMDTVFVQLGVEPVYLRYLDIETYDRCLNYYVIGGEFYGSVLSYNRNTKLWFRRDTMSPYWIKILQQIDSLYGKK